VLLNRPKAAVALLEEEKREAGNEATSRERERILSVSLFGQLFEELHFLEPWMLRMMYTHPMDDGQYRAFKVSVASDTLFIWSRVHFETRRSNSKAREWTTTEARTVKSSHR
jgi:hypothetical protein